jgi:hypothetical protein
MNAELKSKIMSEITESNPKVVVSDCGEYIRIWNNYSGVAASVVYKELKNIARKFGMQFSRVRTFGNGMIQLADWEDRIWENRIVL